MIAMQAGRSRSCRMGVLTGASFAALLVMSLAAFSFTDAAAAAAPGSFTVTRADRKVDLTTQVVRVTTSLKVENTGVEPATEVLIALSAGHAKRLAFMEVMLKEGKGRGKSAASVVPLAVQEAPQQGVLALYSVTLPKPLKKGDVANLETYMALTQLLKPFPEEIGQADPQLVEFHDNAYILSPYPVKAQSSTFKLASTRVESYTKVEPTKVTGAEVRYGPYEDMEAAASKPIALHFENNQPFAVVKELVREVEISHWGNVYVTEHYCLGNQGARFKGSFSRHEYQTRPGMSGAGSFRHLLAKLPPRAHSVYYRDEIGNISTSHLRSDFRRTELEFEPRYPLFGGWKAVFTLGYSVPLQDFVFKAPDGSRFLNISFGCPLNNVVVDNLIVKVILPEGSRGVSVSVPFAVEQRQERKHSYLDTVGRTVTVLVKQNSVFEHQYKFFQVHYSFNPVAMLAEPFLLVLAFLAFFAACVAYAHFDFTISKSSSMYLAQVQREEVVDVLQRLQKTMAIRGAAEERLDASLKEVARTGDVAQCKVERKAADAVWKGTAKDLKMLAESLQAAVKPGGTSAKLSAAKPSAVLTKVEVLLQKEKEMVEKLQQKQTATVDAYERKLSSKDVDARIAPIQEKLDILKQEVYSLLSTLDD